MRSAPLVVALLIAARTAIAGVDVLLVEHPDGLRILDRYQQSVPHPADRGILPWVPIQIVTARDMLSDGFTPAMRVAIHGETFFLLTDERGTPLHLDDAGRRVWHRNVVTVDDTIEILRSLALRAPASTLRTPLQPGTRVRREFHAGSETYVALLGSPGRFGWLSIEQRDRGRLWQPEPRQTGITVTPVQAAELRVRQILRSVNVVLDSLYAFFNAHASSVRRPPHWELEGSNGTLHCTLEGLQDPEAMEESTSVLAKRIELAVSGAGLRVSYTASSIRIGP